MERTTLVFIALLVVLVIGYFYVKENFTDSSGSAIQVSLADLMAILASSSSAAQQQQEQQQQQPIVIVNSPPSPSSPSSASASYDASGNSDLTGAYLSMKNYILTDVKDSIGSQFSSTASPLSSAFAGANSSRCQEQGNAFVQSIPGKSPADDYIRKDSIPCYACSLP